jgi:cytochrome c peroxidase
MMRKLLTMLVGILIGALVAPALADDRDLMDTARGTFRPIPSVVPDVRGVAVTRARIELGKMLFFDPRLSASQVISCNHCHNLAAGGVDAGPTSTGHAWKQGSRRAPSVFNAVFNSAQFWDGRADDLKAQVKGPIEGAIEMNSNPALVEKTLASMPAYVERFQKAFPGDAAPVSFDHVARALEAFEATLITPGSRFDQFLEGDSNALSAQEKEGLAAFMGKGCANCHRGINLGGLAYFPFGLIVKPGAETLPPNDKGRYAVTETPGDEYVFRAAPLRNVALRAPYFHSGQVWSLKQAVGVMGTDQLGQRLTDRDEDAIVAFLQTLTGEQPRVELPLLPPRTDATPLPKP